MESPITVTFLGLTHSDSLEQDIRSHAAKLGACFGELVSCHVSLGLPHRHDGKGNAFTLRIVATTRVDEVAVTREGTRDQLRAVIRDGFDVARRRLQRHEEPRHSGAQQASG
jgi:hypothetical protein